MLRSSSFLKRTVCTPEIAFTTVDLPCATWPIVPMLIVACREITSGVSGVSAATSRVLRSGAAHIAWVVMEERGGDATRPRVFGGAARGTRRSAAHLLCARATSGERRMSRIAPTFAPSAPEPSSDPPDTSRRLAVTARARSAAMVPAAAESASPSRCPRRAASLERACRRGARPTRNNPGCNSAAAESSRRASILSPGSSDAFWTASFIRCASAPDVRPLQGALRSSATRHFAACL